MPAVIFTVLLAALATSGSLLHPSALIHALAAWSLWSAFVMTRLGGISPRTHAWSQRLLLPIGSVAALAFIGRLFFAPPAAAASTATPQLLLPVLILAAFAGFFLQTYASLRARSYTTRDFSATLSAATLKLNTLLYATTAALLFAESTFGLRLQTPWSFALTTISAFWILETTVRAIGRLYQPPRFARTLPPAIHSWLHRPFLSASERTALAAAPSSDAPTLALADMWFLPTLRRLLLPLVAVAAFFLWASSAVHEIPAGHVGLHARFGRLDAEPLSPGFHLTLPAPFHQLTIFPADRLQRIVLGFEADTGQPILWDRGHYIGEQSQLVGSGDDLLTLSVPIYFYVSDPVAFHRHTIDAAQTIRDLAAQHILTHTLRRPAFEIMTTERDALAASLRRDLQTSLDRRDSGLAIALVCLRDIHPPVAVSPAYQEVISALEDREAYHHEGEDYRAENRPRASSDSARLRATADSDAHTRLARTEGETARFSALLASYRASPDIFKIRQRYALFDESLRGVKKLIVDDTFRGRLPTVVDIRKTLNPDFSPPLVPDNPSLLPTLTGKRTDFDRSIDGYLNAGRGAIPAINVQPADTDNLLTPSAP